VNTFPAALVWGTLIALGAGSFVAIWIVGSKIEGEAFFVAFA